MAVEYFHALHPDLLKSVVLSPYPVTPEGKQRLEKLETLFNKARILGISDVNIVEKIPDKTETVFIDAPLTEVANYINRSCRLNTLIMNGGFVGTNLVPYKKDLMILKMEHTQRYQILAMT